MTKFEGCYLTNAGLEIVCATGLAKITFTRAVTGSGLHESKEDIPEMTQLKDQKQEFALEGFTKGEDNTVNVRFKVRNAGLNEAYQLSEIGIYAKGDDGEEKLYCVAYAADGNTETIPAKAEDSRSVEYVTLFNIETVVSADAKVEVIYAEDRRWFIKYAGSILGEINVQADGTVAQQIEAIKNQIREIAEAMRNNSDVVAALEAAIGSKASAAEVASQIQSLQNQIQSLQAQINDINSKPVTPVSMSGAQAIGNVGIVTETYKVDESEEAWAPQHTIAAISLDAPTQVSGTFTIRFQNAHLYRIDNDIDGTYMINFGGIGLMVSQGDGYSCDGIYSCSVNGTITNRSIVLPYSTGFFYSSGNGENVTLEYDFSGLTFS